MSGEYSIAMWAKDEAHEQYTPVKLNWQAGDQAKLDAIVEIKNGHPKTWTAILKYKHGDLFNWLQHRHPMLDSRYSNTTKLYWLAHKLVFWEKCPVCGKTNHMHKDVDSFERGYFRACCQECASANPARQEKIASTTEKRFGSRNYFSSDIGKAKTKEYLSSLGVTNVFQLESVKDKSRKTRKERFGFEYTMQSPEKRALAADNYKEKTGFMHQFYDPAIVAKANITRQTNAAAGIDPKAEFKRNWRARRYESVASMSEEVKPKFTLEYFMQFNSDAQHHVMLDWHCSKCGNDFSAHLDQNFISRKRLPARCPNCHPVAAAESKYEYEISDFIKSQCGIDGVAMHDRKIIAPYEIDIIVPSKKLGIEFDGLYHHSESAGGKSAGYHVFKTAEAVKRGFRLLHIFEDEWVNKREIVESRLKSVLGTPDIRIWARKCSVVRVDGSSAKKFLETDHLQGWAHSSVNLGLEHDGELVALMTFGKPQYDCKCEWKLIRYCSKLGAQVVGGAGKLLKAFEAGYSPKSLLSYADYRWSAGKMYESLGFKLDHLSPPNYWYVKNNVCKRFSRVKFQKFKLKGLFDNFDPGKTEVENMKANGYDRVFDCGNLVYVKDYNPDKAN